MATSSKRKIKREVSFQQVAAQRLSKRRGSASKRLKISFKRFVQQAWHLVEPRKLLWEPHMDVVCAHLVAVYLGQCKRLIINIPPGASKSLLTGVFFPAWVWTRDPTKKFIFATYSDLNRRRDGAKFQQLIESEWYTTRWGDQATDKLWSATYLVNRDGGMRFATTVNGQVTGQHADFQFVDDPIKPQDAVGVSATTGIALTRCFEWWTQTMPTRMTSIEEGRRVIVMQRVADGDLSGEMLSTGEYTHLCLPMEYDPDRHCKTPWGEDWRKEKGEPLAPKRFPPNLIPRLKKELGGPMVVAAQLQQDPVPEGGAVFKKDWLSLTYTDVPKYARWCVSWDLTFKGNRKSDYVAGTVWAMYKGFFYLVEVFNEQLDFPATCAIIRAYAAKYPHARPILIEDAANGPAVVSTLTQGKRRIQGVLPVDPHGDKVARANAVTAYYEAGDVLHPIDADWYSMYFQQMTRFPRAKHDDIVDSVSQGLMYLTGKSRSRFNDAMEAA